MSHLDQDTPERRLAHAEQRINELATQVRAVRQEQRDLTSTLTAFCLCGIAGCMIAQAALVAMYGLDGASWTPTLVGACFASFGLIYASRRWTTVTRGPR